MKYIIAIDQGTTSSRAILFDEKCNIINIKQMEISLSFQKSDWVEQNADELWRSVYEVVKEIILTSNVNVEDIKAIGITNQRETTILWDKNTGKPVHPAIVWQSRQSQSICEDLIKEGYKEIIQEKTGLIINPYFSASKIKFIFDNNPCLLEKAKNGEILFGTVDTYLVWKLTNGKKHITDYSNASRTLLFNINKLEWDQELLKIFNVPSIILPVVEESSMVYGYADALTEFTNGYKIPIASIIGDQQASLFGQCCFNQGDVKNTYGTGCFMLMNTKDNLIKSKNGLLTTIAWGLNGKIEYALEGSVFVGGSAIQWLRDGMHLIEKSSDVEKSSDCISGSNGVYFVPAFVGLGTPYWDDDARGSAFGITRATKKEHFINSVVESIAYQSKDVMEVMISDSGFSINSLAVDGGASVNNYLMQFQADILNCAITRPKVFETTAKGAAFMAGLAVGIWKDLKELSLLQQTDRLFMPHINENVRNRLYNGWKKAVEATRCFKVGDNE